MLVNLCSKNRRVNNKRVNNANEAKNEAIVVATLDSFRASSDINFTSYEGWSGLISGRQRRHTYEAVSSDF